MPRPKWATASPEERLAWHDRPIPKQVATGCLSLHIDRGKDLRTQRCWSDGEKRRLETCLNDVVRGLVATAEAVRLHGLANEEREREWKEQERRRREEEERQQKEARRAEQIGKQIDAWRLARDLRAYVAEVTALVGASELEITGNAEEELRWTLAYADRLDPLTPLREQARDPGAAGFIEREPLRTHEPYEEARTAEGGRAPCDPALVGAATPTRVGAVAAIGA